jgi:hypothetical protein
MPQSTIRMSVAPNESEFFLLLLYLDFLRIRIIILGKSTIFSDGTFGEKSTISSFKKAKWGELRLCLLPPGCFLGHYHRLLCPKNRLSGNAFSLEFRDILDLDFRIVKYFISLM